PYQKEQMPQIKQWLSTPKLMKNRDFTQKVTRFYKKHRAKYLQMRKTDLKRYPSTPEDLPGYQPIDGFNPFLKEAFKNDLGKMPYYAHLMNYKILDLQNKEPFINNLKSYAISFMQQKYPDTLKEFSSRLPMYVYGDMLFADKMKAKVWKITAINRIFAFRFDWNIETNENSNFQLYYNQDHNQ